MKTRKPRLLDLFCGAGGTSVGYAQAGFEVVGVDINPQPRYPFEFHQADALTFPLDGFDAYHASVPCQGFSLASHFHGVQHNYPNLIPAMRERLIATGRPYILENVAGSPLIKAFMLCGTMFGLSVTRHRYFETNILLFQPAHFPHIARTGKPGAIPRNGEYWCIGGHFGHKEDAQRAMGITWMQTQREIGQAIPPAYTRYIGGFLMDAVQPLPIDVSAMFADCEVKYPESYQFIDRQEIGGVA